MDTIRSRRVFYRVTMDTIRSREVSRLTMDTIRLEEYLE